MLLLPPQLRKNFMCAAINLPFSWRLLRRAITLLLNSLVECILKPLFWHLAAGTWSCAPDYFSVYDNREAHQSDFTDWSYGDPWCSLELVALLSFACCTLSMHRNRQVKSSLKLGKETTEVALLEFAVLIPSSFSFALHGYFAFSSYFRTSLMRFRFSDIGIPPNFNHTRLTQVKP